MKGLVYVTEVGVKGQEKEIYSGVDPKEARRVMKGEKGPFDYYRLLQEPTGFFLTHYSRTRKILGMLLFFEKNSIPLPNRLISLLSEKSGK